MLVKRQSRGLSNDGGLRMVNWESQSKTLHQSPEDGHIYGILLIHFFILSCVTCLYRGTHTQAHMYNQHTREMETDRHRSLVERGGRKDLLQTLHTHKDA